MLEAVLLVLALWGFTCMGPGGEPLRAAGMKTCRGSTELPPGGSSSFPSCITGL